MFYLLFNPINPIRRQSQDLTPIQTDWRGSMNQFPPFAMKIIKINLWNQGRSRSEESEIIVVNYWPGRSRSAPVGPCRPRSVPVGPGRPRSAPVGPGRPRSVPVGPGRCLVGPFHCCTFRALDKLISTSIPIHHRRNLLSSIPNFERQVIVVF